MKLKRESIIAKFNEIEDKDPKRARLLIQKLKYKKDHFLLHCIAMTHLDEAQFDDKGKWRKFADRRKLKKAKKYIMKAYALKPKCSNVLWILGKVKTAYGLNDEAIACYKSITKIKPNAISKGCCNNKLSIAKAQINDSKFQLYRLLKNTDSKKSQRYLADYKKGLKKEIFTLYEPIDKFL